MGMSAVNCSSGAGSHAPSVSAGGHAGGASSVVLSGGGGGSSAAATVALLVISVALPARTIHVRVRKDIDMLGLLRECAVPGPRGLRRSVTVPVGPTGVQVAAAPSTGLTGTFVP
jgi:hypothetical protein